MTSRSSSRSSKTPRATAVKISPRDWTWVRLASEGDEHAQARLADLLGWSGDDGHLAIPREHGENYSIVEVEIDGSVYGRYKVQ